MGKLETVANDIKVLQPDANGKFSLGAVSVSDIQSVDISDIDLVVTTKSGAQFILPGGGMLSLIHI